MDGSAPARGMSEAEIVALLDTYASNSYGFDQGTLANERALAIARYNSEPYGNEIEGRSQLVSSELRDTVETVVPQLIRIFLGGDQICEFNPENPEDVQQAKQESKYVNWVVTQRNKAFEVFGTWFRDALICKNGYVKLYWEERSDVQVETYQGLPDDQFGMLMQDQDIELAQHTASPDPVAGLAYQQAQQMGQQVPPEPSMLHDVMIRRKKTKGYVRMDNVPGEEIRVHISTRSLDLSDAIYVEHRSNVTLSMIRQEGYDIPDDWAGTDGNPSLEIESVARDRFSENTYTRDIEGADASTKLVTKREIWARVDEDGDGIAELRRYCLVNRHVLHSEETDMIPIACISPVIQPHRHVGYGYYDFLKDIEKARTSMLRSFFDNLYLANNGRYGVNVDVVNVDDLLISRPGGLIRTKGNPAEGIFPIVHPDTSAAAINGMQYLDGWKKNATGVVIDAQALSADMLNKSTATGISQAISVWQARVESVARSFAETGIVELFRLMHALTLKNATQEEKVQLSGQWVTVDPREWVKRTSLTVTVGLGTGSKEAKIANLQMLGTMQQAGMAIGVATPPNLYETAMEVTKEMGYKDGERFWTDPKTQQPQPPQKDPLVQAEEVKGQVTLQAKQMDGQQKGEELQAKGQVEQGKMAQTATLEQLKIEKQAELERFKVEQQMILERYKADLHAQVEREKSQMASHAQIKSAYTTQGRDMDAEVQAQQAAAQESEQVRAHLEHLHQALQDMTQKHEAAKGPKQFIRNPQTGRTDAVQHADGRVQKVVRGPDGRASGLQ